MFGKIWAALSGAKTYVVAAVTVAYGVVEWWSGAMTQDQALAFIFSGSGLAALRHGVSGSIIAIAEKLLPAVLDAVKQAQKPVAKMLFLALLIGGGLSACSAITGDAVVPKTPREQLAALEVSYTAALRQGDAMLAQGMIPQNVFPTLLLDFQAAHRALDAADAAILAGNPTTVVGALQTAQSALAALTADLERQKQ